MSFLGSFRSLSISSSFIRLNKDACSVVVHGGSTTQVRTATKKVAGSRTNMRDSAGRRLGAKAAENESVKTGQILMRQRGTRFYPGENADIGRDHTIYATEPGFVRFYLDPFHPKRKFIGVALAPELRLPTPHFEPRVRRLGYIPIEDPAKAEFEENNLSRKDHLSKPQILKNLKQRKQKRDQTIELYSTQLKQLDLSLNEKELELAASRLLSVKNQLKNGISLIDAQAITTSIYFQNLKLQNKNSLISNDEHQKFISDYSTLITKVDQSVSFDNKYNITNYISEADRLEKVKDLGTQLQTLFAGKKDRKTKEQIQKLVYGDVLLKNHERKLFIHKFLKPILPESFGIADIKDKKVTVFKRWNYEKQKVDVIPRSKEAFF